MNTKMTLLARIIKVLAWGFLVLVTSCQDSKPYGDLVLPPTPVLNIQTYYAVVQSPYLRVRENPAAESSHTTTLRRGVIVEVISSSSLEEEVEGKKGRWYQILYQARRGWVFGSYIEVYDSLDKARNGVKNLK